MKLRNRFERFCYKNRDKGIPNLMLYVAIGSAIVYILSLVNGGSALYSFLYFDKNLILKGQVWRLITFVFTETLSTSPILQLIFLYFFYNLSRHMELIMGTFKFNLFYFSGVLIMDIFAMIFCPTSAVIIQGKIATPEIFTYYVYANQAFYLHLSLLLLFATFSPNSQFLVMFLIPVKAWFMGIVYILIIGIDIYNNSFLFPHNLFPLAGLLNYLLFAGKDIVNLLPFIERRPARRPSKPQRGTIPFPQKQTMPSYTHKCTICGKTDITNPELEFRYCSRCSGYHCYCQEHINNHEHID